MGMPPRSERPDQTVNPNPGPDFGTLIDSLTGLRQALNNQTSFLERQADASARYAAAAVGPGGLNQIREGALQQIARFGGVSPGMTGPTSQVTGWGALSSLQNLQIYTSQRVGSWLAGVPLFSPPGGGQSGGPQQQGGPGLTPPGTPNSTAAPAGTGAQAVAQMTMQQAIAALGGPPAPRPPATGGGSSGPRGPGAIPNQAAGAAGGGLGGGGGFGRGSQVMQLLGSRIALSGGTAGGLWSAIRGLPGVGLVADLFDRITGVVQDQFQAGRQYQVFEGGTNLQSQYERLHQAAYEASMAFSPLGTQGAAEAFYGVSQLGYNRRAGFQGAFGAGAGTNYPQDRQGALNFIYNQFTQSGATIQESLKELEIASQNSSINLHDLNTVLNDLSDTAGKAGNNAEIMRQSFQAAFQSAVNLGAGPGAPILAGGVAQAQAAAGQAFAGTSFAGELSVNRQYLLAGQLGILPAQAQYIARNQPGRYLGLLAAQNLNSIKNLIGLSDADFAPLRQMVAQAGGNNTVAGNPDLINSIANNWLNWGQTNNPGAFNVDIWATVLASLSQIPLTPSNVAAWVVRQYIGANEAATPAARMSASQASTGTGTATGAATVPANRTAGARTGQYGLAQGTYTPPAANSLHTGLNMAGTTTTWQQTLTSHGGSAAQAYLTEEGRSHQRSPVLEALLQNLNPSDQVAVQTRSGARVMSLTDAMKYYPAELMSGNVSFYSSSGKLLGDTANITQGLTAQEPTAVGQEERGAAGSNRGVSLRQWQRQHPGSATVGAGNTVVVDLSQEARQLLKVLPSNYDAASAAGTVPAVPWPQASSR